MIGSCSSIKETREPALWTRPGIAAVSGRLRQYFFGMCARMRSGLTLAGLKVLS
jgi:hypothetical protein